MDNLTITVDLCALLRNPGDEFRPIVQWARNTLNAHPDGIVGIEPVVVRNLALFIGCQYLDLANYLSRFAPSDELAQPEAPTSHLLKPHETMATITTGGSGFEDSSIRHAGSPVIYSGKTSDG